MEITIIFIFFFANVLNILYVTPGVVIIPTPIIDKKVSKVSIVGVGMITTPGVTFRMFNALAKKNINIIVISTSEIKISVLVDKKNLKKAVDVLHKEFKLDY